MTQRILSIDIGIRNLGISVVDYNETLTNKEWKALHIQQLELIDIVNECQKGKKVRAGSKPKNAKTLNIHVLCQALVQLLLQRIQWVEGVTQILAEQQPLMRGKSTGSVGSSRMKVIQHCILTFYDTYFSLHPELPRPLIQPASPANKLKLVLDPCCFATPPLDKTDKNTDYKQRKAKAVESFGHIIQWCTISEAHKELYTDRKKHDDLADCILQAVFALQVQACKRFKSSKPKQPCAKKRKCAAEQTHANPVIDQPSQLQKTSPHPKQPRAKKLKCVVNQ